MIDDDLLGSLVDDAGNRRQSPEQIHNDLRLSLDEDDGYTEESSEQDTTLLGRRRDAEERVKQQSSGASTEDTDTEDEEAEDNGTDEEKEAEDSETDKDSDSSSDSPMSKSLDQVGLPGRIILIALVAGVIFTAGKYAFDSIFNYSLEKSKTDYQENFDTMMGDDITPTEDIFNETYEAIKNGEYTETINIPYTYIKKSKTVSFVYEDKEYSFDAKMYPEFKFNKKGGDITLTFLKQVDGTVINYTIEEVS